MRLPRIDPRLCNQSVHIDLATGETDNWDKPITEPYDVEKCVVQPQTIYSGDNNNRAIVANAVVFLYAGITTPIPKLDRDKVGSVLIFEDKRYTITKIVDNRNPYSNELWSYELEVL